MTIRATTNCHETHIPQEIAPIAHRVADALRLDLSGVHLEVLHTLPSHVGLGSHTQLALVLGTALTRALGLELGTEEIARAAGRGGTSGIGANSFRCGGLVVDGGHTFGPGAEKELCRPSSATRAPVPPLIARYELPEQWRFVLVTPATQKGASGSKEVSLFEQAFPLEDDETGEVCRQVLMGLMPAAARGDIHRLGQSITALQSVGFKAREVALQPRPVQELLGVLVDSGAAGAGLSSFGPTVYGLAANHEQGTIVLDAALSFLTKEGIDADGWVAAPDNDGVVIDIDKS